MRKLALTVVLAGLFTGSVVAQPDWQTDGSYNYTTLDVPGATGTSAWGIDGENIVGTYSFVNHRDYVIQHGFMYDGSTYTTIARHPDECCDTWAWGIDGSNIVGGHIDGYPPLLSRRHL